MAHLAEGSILDVGRYPPAFLQIFDDCVRIQATYKKVWDDGFGARGWKLNVTIGDPEIIASTRETGPMINTSVFVHDILDHFLSGFGVSGHRSEAMALIQLSKRTGSDPRPDYEQMVKEDILKGRVNGEKFTTFLPAVLCSMLPSNTEMANKEIIVFLKKVLGENRLFELLVKNFFTRGKAGEIHAAESWRKLGLDPSKKTEIGLALQGLLNRVDSTAEETGAEMFEASITVNNKKSVLTVHDSSIPQSVYSANVA